MHVAPRVVHVHTASGGAWLFGGAGVCCVVGVVFGTCALLVGTGGGRRRGVGDSLLIEVIDDALHAGDSLVCRLTHVAREEVLHRCHVDRLIAKHLVH